MISTTSASRTGTVDAAQIQLTQGASPKNRKAKPRAIPAAGKAIRNGRIENSENIDIDIDIPINRNRRSFYELTVPLPKGTP